MESGHSYAELQDLWLYGISPCREASDNGLQNSCFRIWNYISFQGYPICSHRA